MIYRGYCSYCDLWALFGVTEGQNVIERDYEVHRAISPVCEHHAFTDTKPYVKPDIKFIEVRAALPEDQEEFEESQYFADINDDKKPFDVN